MVNFGGRMHKVTTLTGDLALHVRLNFYDVNLSIQR